MMNYHYLINDAHEFEPIKVWDGLNIDEDALLRWAENHEQNRQVARTETPDWVVSTVWLGRDSGFMSPIPILFETMVFGKTPLDHSQERYATWDEAMLGHLDTVERVKAATPLDAERDAR